MWSTAGRPARRRRARRELLSTRGMGREPGAALDDPTAVSDGHRRRDRRGHRHPATRPAALAPRRDARLVLPRHGLGAAAGVDVAPRPRAGGVDPRAHPAHRTPRTRFDRLLHLHRRLVSDHPDRGRHPGAGPPGRAGDAAAPRHQRHADRPPRAHPVGAHRDAAAPVGRGRGRVGRGAAAGRRARAPAGAGRARRSRRPPQRE